LVKSSNPLIPFSTTIWKFLIEEPSFNSTKAIFPPSANLTLLAHPPTVIILPIN